VFSQLNQKINFLQNFLLFAVLLFLPFQLAKHFWPSFAFVSGQRVDYLSPTIYISDVLILLLFLTILIKFFFRGQKTEDRKQKSVYTAISPYSVFCLLIFFLSLGIFLSKSPMNGWYSLLKLSEFTFFAWIVAKDHEKIQNKLFYTFTIGIIVEGVLGILQFFNHRSINGLWYFLGERTFNSATPGIANASIHGQLILRPYGTFPHPNVFAGYLVIGLLYFLTWIFTTTDKFQKTLSLIILIFGFTVLLLTLSRVAILVFCILALMYIVWKFSRLKYLILFVTCIFFFGIFLTPLFSGRFLEIESYSDSFQLRDILIQIALRMFISLPIFGVGLGNFLTSIPYYISSKQTYELIQPVHNIFLLVLAETGAVGFGAFLFVLFLAFKNNLKHHPLRLPLYVYPLFSLTAISLIGLTDHYFLTLQQGQILLALVLGLSFKETKVQRDKDL